MTLENLLSQLGTETKQIADSLWTNYSMRVYSDLRVQYNNALRILLGLPWRCSASTIFAERRIDGFKAIIRKRCASLLTRVRGSNNTIQGVFIDRYSEYTAPVHEHDHHVYYTYEPPAHTHIGSSKHNYGGGHKSNASMSALTLLAFLFFLHILQQCIKDHMTDINSVQPVVVMTASREGDETISKSVTNKIDKTGITQIDDKANMENNGNNGDKQYTISNIKNIESQEGSINKKQILKILSNTQATKADERYQYVYKNIGNRSTFLSGSTNTMDEV